MSGYPRGEEEYSQPLLEAHRANNGVLFAANEGEDDYEDSALLEQVGKSDVLVSPSFGPPLRSTLQSREAGTQLSNIHINLQLIMSQ
jgi:hypothetical protein